ncbi:MAG: hypothetical protein A3H45_12505 [Ignavibacteria bacterium RIFCSPLOWO2_02_FULL_55_14]|nr:MAG: hypothetical protein A3H45_12505 [Ignavibacteria bacterium RIFCSPLOWO2_02_FULL_55_14]
MGGQVHHVPQSSFASIRGYVPLQDNTKPMRYAKGAFITLLARGLTIPIGIASAIVTARTLGPDGRGVLAAIMVLQGLAIQFGTLGFNGSTMYFLSHKDKEPRVVVSSSFVAALVFGSLVALAMGALYVLAPQKLFGSLDRLYIGLLLASLPLTFVAQFLQNVLVARDALISYNVIDLALRTFQLLGFVVALVLLSGGTSTAIAILLGISAAGGVVYAATVRRSIPFGFHVELRLFRQMLQYGMRTYLASMLSFLLIRLNMLLISPTLGDHAAGLFSVNLQFLDLAAILPTTLGVILFPRVARNEQDAGDLTAKVFRFTVASVGLFCLTLALAAKPILVLMFGEPFAESSRALQLLTPGIFALALVSILNNDLAGRGLPRSVLWALVAGVASSSAIQFIFLGTFGIEAASVGTSTGALVTAGVLLIIVRKYWKAPWRQLWILSLADLRTLSPRNLLSH